MQVLFERVAGLAVGKDLLTVHGVHAGAGRGRHGEDPHVQDDHRVVAAGALVRYRHRRFRRLRLLTRYRMQLMRDRSGESIRLELMLQDASIKLSSVASTLTTVSARAMLTAMIEGERDHRRRWRS